MYYRELLIIKLMYTLFSIENLQINCNQNVFLLFSINVDTALNGSKLPCNLKSIGGSVHSRRVPKNPENSKPVIYVEKLLKTSMLTKRWYMEQVGII